MRRKKKAFTLLELIVAMAIVAVLIGLSILGINTVQRNARNAERRATLEEINYAIQEVMTAAGRSPTHFSITGGGTQFNISEGTASRTVVLKGAAKSKVGNVQNQWSDATGTVYCYTDAGPAAYRLSFHMEGNDWNGWSNTLQLGNMPGWDCTAGNPASVT